MAMTFAIEDATPLSIVYSCTEAATAADVVARDVLADLAAQGFGAGNPLFDLLNPNVADQAAGRNLLETNCDLIEHTRAAAAAGATGRPVVTLDATVSGGGAGNFRLSMGAQKAANGDSATFIVRLALRHSLID